MAFWWFLNFPFEIILEYDLSLVPTLIRYCLRRLVHVETLSRNFHRRCREMDLVETRIYEENAECTHSSSETFRSSEMFFNLMNIKVFSRNIDKFKLRHHPFTAANLVIQFTICRKKISSWKVASRYCKQL